MRADKGSGHDRFGSFMEMTFVLSELIEREGRKEKDIHKSWARNNVCREK